MSSLMSTYRSIVDNSGKDSPKPSSGGTQRSNTSLTKVEPWFDNESLELISNPGSGKGPRKFLQPFTPEVKIGAFKPVPNDLRVHLANTAFEGVSNLNELDKDGFSFLHRAVRGNDFRAVNALLDNGADIDIKGRDGFTPLHAAVRFESTDIVKLLLERGVNPVIPNNNMLTPLHSAARRGNTEICRLLMEDPRVKDIFEGEGFMKPIHFACMSGSREACELFLRHGDDISSKSGNSYTALHIACFFGHEEICELLIECASKEVPSLTGFLNVATSEGFTALHIVSEAGHERLADLLLRHGTDREAITLTASASPLHLAAKNGHLSLVELLILYGSVIDCRNGKLRTPLHSAAAFNHCRIIEILLDSGADLEAKDVLEMTPLLMAVTHGKVEAAKLLLERGADITATDSSLNSALHLAILYRMPEMVKFLLENDKDCVLVQMKDKDVKTVLHLAAGLETSEILEIFLENKVCIRGHDINEKLPLHIAAETGSLDCVLAFSKLPNFTSLLNEREENGMTTLHMAARNGHTKTCEVLISKGADVTTKEGSGSTPLHLAAKTGSLKTAKVLSHCLLPSTLEERDRFQNTPLHIACRYNHVDVLQFLLDQGADVTARNDRNMTCLDIAIEWEFAEVAKTLVKHKRWEEVIQLSAETGAMPMMQLVEKLPDVAEIVLDKCVTLSPLPPSHEDFSITFNVRHLDPDVDCVCFVPATMARFKREKLLNHVVTQALLRFKWMVLGKFFTFFNTVVFLTFVIMYSCFVVKERNRSALFIGSSNTTASNEIYQKSRFEEVAPCLIFVFLIGQLIKEVSQLSWMRFAYFKEGTNFLELWMHAMVWIFTLPSLFGKEIYSIETRWNAGLIGLFLSYVVLNLHLRRYGGFGLYVTMYSQVLWTFLKVISTFIIALIGYSLVFYLLLSHQDNFSSFLFALAKVHVMMIGELDYTDILVDNIVNSDTVPGTNVLYIPLPTLTVSLFFIFVLLISVVLVNLLVGLAVGDIESIQRTASLRNLIDDALVVEGIMKSYPKFIVRRVHRRSLEFKPNRNTLFKRIALAGTDVSDQNFMEKLLNYRTETINSEEEFCNQEEVLRERQDEIIHKLLATVEAQGKILKAMADRLNIPEYED